jgi:menaquinone-dependent protoporphyrinogen oxidase
LVACASRAGSTAEIADFIGKSLADKGSVVDVKRMKNIRDITGYQAVVIGSAVRRGKLLPEAGDFVKLHKKNMRKIPVAYFVVCATLRENTEEKREIANAYLDPLCDEVAPVYKGLFAGKLDYSKRDSISKNIMKNVRKAPEGDFRDWEAVKKWADDVLPKLILAKN